MNIDVRFGEASIDLSQVTTKRITPQRHTLWWRAGLGAVPKVLFGFQLVANLLTRSWKMAATTKAVEVQSASRHLW